MVGFPAGKGLLTQLWGPPRNPIHLPKLCLFPCLSAHPLRFPLESTALDKQFPCGVLVS